jgi:hypothetical protein
LESQSSYHGQNDQRELCQYREAAHCAEMDYFAWIICNFAGAIAKLVNTSAMQFAKAACELHAILNTAMPR